MDMGTNEYPLMGRGTERCVQRKQRLDVYGEGKKVDKKRAFTEIQDAAAG
jgi:hypothetical protein